MADNPLKQSVPLMFGTTYLAAYASAYEAAREGGGVVVSQWGWIGQYRGGQYEINQVMIGFDPSSLPGQIATANLVLNIFESYGPITLEVREHSWTAGSPSSFVPGSQLSTKRLAGSVFLASGRTGEVVIPLDVTGMTGPLKFVLAISDQRLGIAPTADNTVRMTAGRLDVEIAAPPAGASGEGAVNLARLVGAGAGVFKSLTAGVGSTSLHSMIGKGVGRWTPKLNAGSGAGVFGPLVGRGAGVNATIGSAPLTVLKTLAGDALGLHGSTGSGSTTLGVLEAAGRAGVVPVGSGATTLSNLTGGASVTHLTNLHGAAFLSPMTAEGRADHGVTGDGFAVLGRLIATGRDGEANGHGAVVLTPLTASAKSFHLFPGYTGAVGRKVEIDVRGGMLKVDARGGKVSLNAIGGKVGLEAKGGKVSFDDARREIALAA